MLLKMKKEMEGGLQDGSLSLCSYGRNRGTPKMQIFFFSKIGHTPLPSRLISSPVHIKKPNGMNFQSTA